MPLGINTRLAQAGPVRGVSAITAITALYDATARTLSGAAPASIELIVTIDGSDQASRPTSDGSGRWTFSVTGLSNGSHSYSVRASTGASGSLTIGGASAAGGTLDFSDPANSGHIPGI